jgi:hypothetical protein
MADEEPRTNHPIEVVEVPFYGDSIEASRDPRDGSFYVPIRRVCENLGITTQRQLEKLKGWHWATVSMIATVAQGGKRRELAFLPLAQVPAWLTHINPNKVGGGPELVEKLRRYQVEAVDVLYRHFIGPQPGPQDPIVALAQSVIATRQAQLALEGRVDAIQRQVGDLVVLRTAALRVLTDVPRAEEPAAPLSVRAKVNMPVRNYVAAHGVEYQDVCGELAAIIGPVIVGAVRPDLPSILTPLVAEILKDEPPGTGTRGGLKLLVEGMSDAVERLVEIAIAVQQQNALAQQQLDAARLANQLPELDQELSAQAGEIVAMEALGGALDAPPRLEEMSHNLPPGPRSGHDPRGDVAVLSGGREPADRDGARRIAATPRPRSAHPGCLPDDASRSGHRIDPTPGRCWRRSCRPRRIDAAAR